MINLKKLFKDDLIKHTAVVFIGTSVVGFFNLIYQLVSVRMLTPSDYGTFNALISLVMFVSMTVSPLGPVFVRFFTEYITKKEFGVLKSTCEELIKRITVITLFLLLFFVLFSHQLAVFFKTEISYIVICGAIIGMSLPSLIFPALFQSFQKFKAYSFMGIVSSFAKLTAGSVLMYMGWSVFGGLSGYLASPLVILIISLFMIFKVYPEDISGVKSSKTVSLMPIYKYFFPVAIAMFSFTVLTNIDVVLVKHFFSSLDAGYYSVAQMVGKIFLFLPSALAIVIFPKSTASYVNNAHSHKLLYKSLLLATSVCGIGVIFCFLFPQLVLNILTSKANPISTSLVGIFALTMSFYALVWIIINYSLATHNLKIVFPLCILAIMESLLIWYHHTELKTVLIILCFFAIICFSVTLGIISLRDRKRQKA